MRGTEPTPPGAGPEAAGGDRVRRILTGDLERRLRILESAGEAEFGPFTPIDWVVCLLLFVVLPLALVVWCA